MVLFLFNQYETNVKHLSFREFFSIVTENELIFQHQSDVKPWDSCINRPLYISQEINNSFDEGVDVCKVSLNISKAFDKIWHKDIIFKLIQNDISDDLLNLLSIF